MKEDALCDVEVAAVGTLGGQVQRADGEDSTHDVVASQTQLDDVIAPERPDAGVGGECGVGLGGEVVEQF